MDIIPIRNDVDHKAALTHIESLWNAKPGTDDFDKLDLLSLLVERYEAARWPIDVSHLDPIDLLNYLISENGHTQSDLGRILGSQSRASEILNRKRALTVDMIRRISAAWKMPADLLIGEIELATI